MRTKTDGLVYSTMLENKKQRKEKKTKTEQESWLLPTERASAVKTRMNGLSGGEKIMTIRSAVLIQYQRVTDRRTDGQNLDS